MLKKYRNHISITLFLLAVASYFFIDIYQNEWEKGSEMRKAFFFNGMNIVQVLFALSFTFQFKGVVNFVAYSWMAYVFEIMYDRLTHNGEFELQSWVITILFIKLYLLYKFYQYAKRKRAK